MAHGAWRMAHGAWRMAHGASTAAHLQPMSVLPNNGKVWRFVVRLTVPGGRDDDQGGLFARGMEDGPGGPAERRNDRHYRRARRHVPGDRRDVEGVCRGAGPSWRSRTRR